MEKSFSVFASSCQDLLATFLSAFKSPPVVMCVGEPKFSQDLLGPLVGTMLKKFGYKNYVYGTLDCPINANNFELAQSFVKKMHQGQAVLMIDASTSSQPKRLGQIVLKQNYVPFNPVLKKVQPTADWFLFGVCSVASVFPQMFYAKTLLTKKLAGVIAKSLSLI